MYEDINLQFSKIINCFIHKKEKATHICTDLYCHTNPLICQMCMNDSKYRVSHSSHQHALRNVSQAIDFITSMIKMQTKPIQYIYERTIGSRDHELIRFNIQKGKFLMQQLQNRIETLKIQIDLEIELLVKEFQKQMQFQKQQLAKKLEDYKRNFINNIELVNKQCFQMIGFQSSLKYYNNPNNLILKLINGTSRRSLEWFIKQKKTLSKVNSILETPQYQQNLLQQLTKINKMNMMVLPFWKAEKNQVQNQNDLKVWIKNNTKGWIQIPEVVDLAFDGNNGRHQEFLSYKTLQNYYQMPAS